MTNPSPPSSPFEQVVEAMAHAAFYDGKTPWEEADSRDREEAIWGAQEALQAALDTGLLKLVEERPKERDEDLHGASASGPSPDPGARTGQGPETRLPEVVGLCPDPSHTEEFYLPHGGTCPCCPEQLVEYRQAGEQPRGEPLDGAEAHELYSMFLAHVCSSEFHPRHPLITGAEKLAAMLDEDHARFSEVLSDDDDLAEQPRGQRQDSLSEQMADLKKLAVEHGMYDAHDWLRAQFHHFPESPERPREGPHDFAAVVSELIDKWRAAESALMMVRDSKTLEEAKSHKSSWRWDVPRYDNKGGVARLRADLVAAIDNPSGEGPRLTREEWRLIEYAAGVAVGVYGAVEPDTEATKELRAKAKAVLLTPSDTEQASREPKCTCERGANLDHWSRCDVHRVERSYTAPLTPSDPEAGTGEQENTP